MLKSATQFIILTTALCKITAGAISIVLDYSYDTGSYFSDERKYIGERAAYAFESRLQSESFGHLDPAQYGSSVYDFPFFKAGKLRKTAKPSEFRPKQLPTLDTTTPYKSE